MAIMTVRAHERDWVPSDRTFGARLALIRQEMSWNIRQAAVECGLNPQSWRTWERDGVRPRELEAVVSSIVRKTGVNFAWLAFGPSAPFPGQDSQSVMARLTTSRLALGWSVPEIAAAVGLDAEQHWERWESDPSTLLDPELISGLVCNALSIDYEWLTSGREPDPGEWCPAQSMTRDEMLARVPETALQAVERVRRYEAMGGLTGAFDRLGVLESSVGPVRAAELRQFAGLPPHPVAEAGNTPPVAGTTEGVANPRYGGVTPLRQVKRRSSLVPSGTPCSPLSAVA